MRKGSKLASNDVPQFSLLFQRFRFLSHQTERQVGKEKRRRFRSSQEAFAEQRRAGALSAVSESGAMKLPFYPLKGDVSAMQNR